MLPNHCILALTEKGNVCLAFLGEVLHGVAHREHPLVVSVQLQSSAEIIITEFREYAEGTIQIIIQHNFDSSKNLNGCGNTALAFASLYKTSNHQQEGGKKTQDSQASDLPRVVFSLDNDQIRLPAVPLCGHQRAPSRPQSLQLTSGGQCRAVGWGC